MKLDDVVSGCLSRIRRGEMTAVGVLADYLAENRMTGAATVRRYWDKYVSAVQWTHGADFSRRKNTKWENVALWSRWLRRRVAKLYDRKWKPMELKKFI